MNEQPEALRLADALDHEFIGGRITNHTGRQAAAELRWLHEENEQLRKVPKWFHCDTHGQGNLNAWGCPECVRELRNENERLRDAVKAEREACLALVNQGTGEATSADALKILRMERDRISAAIRARGQEQPR